MERLSSHQFRNGNTAAHPIFWMRPERPALTVNAAPGSAARAIISEIMSSARRLLAEGQGSSIDLRFLKAMPEERETLANLLGRGEVSAVVDAIGRSEIRETAMPCVWWIRHLNNENEMVGELIEITEIPDLLVGDREAIAFGLEALRLTGAPNTPQNPV
ncbi:MAG: hydrogenase expression protein HupH [Proteobacteria bacterium]|nr:hydrogenase expression protein HupH [Pseudomonadota bacterium]